MGKGIFVAWAAGLLLAGCSSRPREFTPMMGYAPADQAGFDSAYTECRQLYVDGKLDGEGRLASGAGGAAAGGAVGVAGAAAATSAGLAGGGVALASATVVLLPVALVGGAIGMAKAKRKKKEAAIQRVMTGCLAERGYAVQSWQRAPRTGKSAAQ